MAQHRPDRPPSRILRAANRIGTIFSAGEQAYRIEWEPLIKWRWLRIGTTVLPWCPLCGAIIGGKVRHDGTTSGQTVHEKFHAWLNEQLTGEETTASEDNEDGAGQNPEDSGPAFYDDGGYEDPGQDSGA